ncbi:MAG: TlpA family protein disulfide reductase [Patescibacteria group bacterium]|nr:TlpA family protein disulfide reductase [Patescibacteria group bacterium]
MQKNIIIAIGIIVLAGIGLYAAFGNSGASSAQSTTGTQIGDIAPAFSIKTIDGKTITSADLRGRVVVISSAAQWCPTCQEEAREFAPVYQKYKDKPVVFITIDIDPRDTDASIEAFKKTYQTPWAYADAAGGADVIQKYGMNRFEMTFIIDKNGKIAFNGDVLTRPDVLDNVIAGLL